MDNILTGAEVFFLLQVLECTCDEGPPHAGWKSDKLELIIEKLEFMVKGSKDEKA